MTEDYRRSKVRWVSSRLRLLIGYRLSFVCLFACVFSCETLINYFKGRCKKLWETEWSACGFSRAHKYLTEHELSWSWGSLVFPLPCDGMRNRIIQRLRKCDRTPKKHELAFRQFCISSACSVRKRSEECINLTPLLPLYHMKTTNKGGKSKAFLSSFSHWHVKGFSSKRIALKVDVL